MLLTLANGFLDSYTYLSRGGVFANAQTGNVIFFAIDMSGRKWGDALAHLWPILSFVVGVMLSSHIKSGRVERFVPHPMRWAMALQATVLAIVGFVPASVPHSWVTVPIAFVAAMQIGLFRNIGELNYIAVATTGNLMRLVEAGYAGFVERKRESITAAAIYSGLVTAFGGGAVIGAFATRAWGVHSIWLASGFLAITLMLFLIDARNREQP